ncbi:MAG: 3-hydroxyacyl-CoA dehydrogenase NAD-binding domain-containing protein [Vulcanimicrobiaceae bacterium]
MEDSLIVVGAGTMGTGIAFVAARGGYSVDVIEPDAGARERGKARIDADIQRAGDAAIAARITWHDVIPERSRASIAIEAVPEEVQVKMRVLAALEGALDPGALLATNTSSLSVSELCEGLKHPERALGIHFFNPPAVMKLVEIVWTSGTEDVAIERARAFVERIEKSAVLAADTPGFIVNRVARPFYLQAMRALEEGAAPLDTIDALARAAGFRMGPFELVDLIGMDVNLAVSESIYVRTDQARLIPLDVQREMVEQGRLGRKSGVGFYDYRNGVPERHDLRVDPPSGEPIGDEVVAIIGFGSIADEIAELLERRYTHVQRVENDDLIDELRLDATIVIDIGDGTSDRSEILASLDSLLGVETVLFVDAYATDVRACAKRMLHAERLVGYGILGGFESQRAVEIVDTEGVSDDALALAQEFFEQLGKGVALVADVPGLVLGRIVGSIVNEAVVAVHENVATADDIDLAMRLGTNYPIGPIAWGREIGGARIARILNRLAQSQGEAFAPHRSLWVLDALDEPEEALEPLDPQGIGGGIF